MCINIYYLQFANILLRFIRTCDTQKNMLQRFTNVTLQEGRIAHARPHLENGSLKYYLYWCVHMNAAAYQISQPVKSLHTL